MYPPSHIYPEPARHARTWAFAGTVAAVDFLIPVSGGVDMSGCPEGTPPCRLWLQHEEETSQSIVLTGEDGVNFTVTVPGAPVAGAGNGMFWEGSVLAIVSGGAFSQVTAQWWTGSRAPRRRTDA